MNMQHEPAVTVPQEIPGAKDGVLARIVTAPEWAREPRYSTSVDSGAATRRRAYLESPLQFF